MLMENVMFPPKTMTQQTLMFPFKSPPTLLRITSAARRLFASTTTTVTVDPELVAIPKTPTPTPEPSGTKRRASLRGRKAIVDAEQLKLDWLDSLSCPLQNDDKTHVAEGSDNDELGTRWVIGVDPDIYGAVAVINPHGCPQVYDSPHLKVLVGKRVRKRLDVKSIIQLLRNIDVPTGTTAYVEQSIPYPQDGKQGWWSGGFGYGLWIGILVASGYSVVPVPSLSWKTELKLAGSRSSKDDSRELASTLFPSIDPMLKRKKDHGRAEALLIAAYGRGLKVKIDSSSALEDLTLEAHALNASELTFSLQRSCSSLMPSSEFFVLMSARLKSFVL